MKPLPNQCPYCGQQLRQCPVCRSPVVPHNGNPNNLIAGHNDKKGNPCGGSQLKYIHTVAWRRRLV